jgi:acyl-CoA thioester hydrolase
MFTGAVEPDWIDHNGHMNVAYYVLAFDLATDAAYEAWGIGLDYPEQTNCSVFTLGMNVDYRAEMHAGEPFRVATSIVDFDHKRIHYFHTMYRGQTNEVVATNECLVMNVDLATRRSAEFPPEIVTRLTQLQVESAPTGFGRILQIRRKDAASC